MHLGYAPGDALREADLIVVLESDVPWFPHLERPRAGARMAHVGIDPTFARYPMRSFPSDLAIAGEPRIVLEATRGGARFARRRRADRKAAGGDRRARVGAASAGARDRPDHAGVDQPVHRRGERR